MEKRIDVSELIAVDCDIKVEFGMWESNYNVIDLL